MESSESINTQTPVVPLKRDHVVILVHGIRDYALWQNDIRAELEDAGFKVELSNYERFNLLAFLEPSTIFRRQAISEVWEDIKTIRQNHRDADISVIAHSFGTYVMPGSFYKTSMPFFTE